MGLNAPGMVSVLARLFMMTWSHMLTIMRWRHDFTTAASQANQGWVTDITEHLTKEGKLYFCAVKDIFSNRIIGYAAGSHMSSSLAFQH